MARPAKLKLAPVVYGDTWNGLTVSMASTGNAFASTLSSVRMHFRDSAGTLGLSLASSSGITITSAGSWAFTVDSRVLTLAVGTWYWSIECTDAASQVKTYLAGTIPILNDATT